MGEEVGYCDINKPVWKMNYYGVKFDDTLGEEAMDMFIHLKLQEQ